MTTSSAARVYALVIGAVLVLAGVIGFAYSASFGSPGDVDSVLGILDVNAWHNVVHIATGALGLLLFRTAARKYALGLGIVYVNVAIWGFAIGGGESILGFIPINTEDNVLHLAIGLTGLAAGAASGRAVTPSSGLATAPDVWSVDSGGVPAPLESAH
jgi:Domain of unknown function (DUF4383)